MNWTRKMRYSNLSRYIKADSGIAAIEFAFIMPLLLFLFFGLVDVTDGVSYNRRITSVANSIGDLASQNRTKIIKTNIDDYFKAVDLIMKPKSAASVRVILYGFRKNAGGTAGEQIWKVDNGKGPSCNRTPDTAGMTTLMTAGNDLIVAQSCMDYTPVVTEFLGTKILGTTSMKIEQIITMRPRASKTLDCYLTATATTSGC
jgi:Flp pilus assembly protein TadG